MSAVTTPATACLADLEVLVLDCQTTGANPSRGHLLEVAWARVRASAGAPSAGGPVRAELVDLPAGESLPRRITALTGIRSDDLASARPVDLVWRDLLADAAALGLPGEPVPAVAHFARFERSFLEALHDEVGAGTPFPLDLLCTHEIACRLFPGLPRRGLRAVAGHLGHVMGELKRAEGHVRATALVWCEIVHALAEEHDVTTRADLDAWMQEVAPRRRGGRDFAVPRETRLDLPDAPGVYRMLGRGGEILYVGKARSLRSRVNSYFQKRRHAGAQTMEMLTQVFAVDVDETASPLEAALLEADTIKVYAPPYNTALRGVPGAPRFLAQDLDESAETPDRAFRLGPFPRCDLADTLVAARRLVADGPRAGSGDEAALRTALALAEDAPLDLAVLEAGVEAFRREHGLLSRSVLLGLGARLWRAWIAEREARRVESEAAQSATDVDDDNDDVEETSADEPEARGPWSPETPEQVVSRLESIVRQGAHLVRRGRWLRTLVEAGLVFRPPGRDRGAPWRSLVLEKGRIIRAEDVPPGTAAPLPPGWPRSRQRRLRALDLPTYDRLRVLTTELRRVVGAGAPVEIRLAPHRRLDAAALARRLWWV